jgi:hypothetical protein
VFLVLFSSRDLPIYPVESHGRRNIMSPITLEQAFDQLTGVDVPGPATRFIEEKQEALLAADVEDLAALRFGIVLTAKWESDLEEDPQHRKELRGELASLRTRYFDKIDDVAMTFGVAIAMKVKEEVERRVALPLRAGFADRLGGAAKN